MRRVGIIPFLFLAIVALIPAQELDAQINSPAGRTLFARTFMWRSDFRYIRISRILVDGEEIPDPSNQKTRVAALENFFVYGLLRDTTVMAIVPFLNRNFEAQTSQPISETDTGFGDPTFLIQYDGIYKQNRPLGFTRLAGFFGVKAPLGKDTFSTDSADYLMGSIFSYWQNRWFYSVSGQYTATTEANAVDAGDVFRYDVSAMYKLFAYPEWKDLFFVLELNGELETKARQNGTEFANTGGHTIFVSPGVEFFLQPNMVLEFSFQIPTLQNLNGLQPGKDFSLVVGLRYVY